MRQTTVTTARDNTLKLPRGWYILAAALASWALFAVAWNGMMQLFTFVAAAI